MKTADTRTSPVALETERKWGRFVEEFRAGGHAGFEEHWATFQRLQGKLRREDGPLAVWRPDGETLTGSNLARMIHDLDVEDYAELYAWSVREREAFWQEVIRRVGIVFSREAGRTLDPSSDPRHPHWLPGAEMNIVDSCLSNRHDAPALLVGREGSSEISVIGRGRLGRLVDRVAQGLVAQGFGREDAIALYMPMTLECVAAYLGIIRAGCRVVSIADSFAPAELSRRLEIGKARGLVTAAKYVRGGRTIDLYRKVKDAASPRAIVVRDRDGGDVDLREGDILWEEMLGAEEPLSVSVAPDSVTNILFSSGTTADPKAIPWTHITPIKCAMDGYLHQDIRPGDVVAWPTNIGWMMGPWLIHASLINGASIALYEGTANDPGFAKFVQDAHVSVLGVVPSLVRAWRAIETGWTADWSRIRVFSSTGEPSDREDYLWLMSRAGYRAPVIEYCGGTEIGGGYVTGTVLHPCSPATFTTPALGLEMVILGENGKPVREGKMGEVFLVPPSIGLSQDLLNRDHDEIYYKDVPRGPRGKLLRRHGDQLVRLPGGFYRAQGRADDTMNLGGIKVSSIELEQVVNSHPAVVQSAAVSVQPSGEGAGKLVVFAVTTGPIDTTELKMELGDLVARQLNPLFKIHDLVVTEGLPYTATNKLMRRKLREAYRPSGAEELNMAQRQPPAPSVVNERSPDVQLNLNVRGLPNSATVAINEISDQLRGQGRHIYKLGLGQSPFPVPEPVVEALRRNAHQKDYLPVKGLRALREAIAEHHLRDIGVKISADDILIGPGSKELMFLLQLVYYGDLVIPTPAWVSYEPQARIIGRHVHFLPTRARTGWKVTAEQVDALCRTDPTRPRILILNYPSNPTGGSYEEAELRELARLALKYRVILLSDEIYGKLNHTGDHVSIVPFYPEGSIFSGGLSKWCGAGGWRLGVFAFPKELRWLLEAMASVASETYTSTSAPIQHAAVAAFQENPEIDLYLRDSRRVLGALGRKLTGMMTEAGIRVRPPAGAFYLFPDLRHQATRLHSRGIRSSGELCERLLQETGVAILPGSNFGRPPEELTVRLAYVNFDGERVLEAVRRLPQEEPLDEAFLREYCRETLEAVERLCEWVNR